jgi:hypothetical protein
MFRTKGSSADAGSCTTPKTKRWRGSEMRRPIAVSINDHWMPCQKSLDVI